MLHSAPRNEGVLQNTCRYKYPHLFYACFVSLKKGFMANIK